MIEYSNYEKMISVLMRQAYLIYENDPLTGSEYLIYWDNGLAIRCIVSEAGEENPSPDTFGEDEEERYEGPNWSTVIPLEILSSASGKTVYPCVVGESMALNLRNIPSKITTVDGQVLWERQDGKENWWPVEK